MVERLNPSLREGKPGPPHALSHGSSPSSTSQYLPADPSYSRGTDPILPTAYDLLEKMLLPDMTKRITAREALFHPFLVEGIAPSGRTSFEGEDTNMLGCEDEEFLLESRECEDPDTGETLVVRGDDIYFPHPVGEGICSKGHWYDEDTGDQFCFEIVDNGTKRKPRRKDREQDHPGNNAKREREKIAKERARGIYRLDLGACDADSTDDAEKPHPTEPRIVKVRLRKLEAGEGIAIGLEPCEFHSVGVVDASFYYSHVRAMEEGEDGEDYGDGEYEGADETADRNMYDELED